MKALLCLANGSEEMEAVITSDILSRAGFEVTRVSIEESTTVKCANGVTLKADSNDLTVASKEAVILILPGGWHGTLAFCKVNPISCLCPFNLFL